MNYKLLYIFVEGNDDERFFQKIIKPKFENKKKIVKIIKYSQKKKKNINNYIKSIKSIKADYIFISDINNSPCITHKKQNIQKQFANIDPHYIILVIKEIESWFLAGINERTRKKFKLNKFDDTDSITKGKFNSMIPKKIDSHLNFILEILENFSFETAKQRNSSFRYFVAKYKLEEKG